MPRNFELVEAALDDVAALVGGAVEARWATSGSAALVPVDLLVTPFRNGGRDSPSA